MILKWSASAFFLPLVKTDEDGNSEKSHENFSVYKEVSKLRKSTGAGYYQCKLATCVNCFIKHRSTHLLSEFYKKYNEAKKDFYDDDNFRSTQRSKWKLFCCFMYPDLVYNSLFLIWWMFCVVPVPSSSARLGNQWSPWLDTTVLNSDCRCLH